MAESQMTESQTAGSQGVAGEIQVIGPGQLVVEGRHQTKGMLRAAAVSAVTTGNQKIWMGYVTMPPGAVSGVHHHADCETGIYLLSGHARWDFGPDLDRSVLAGPGDFVWVPPFVVHREANLSEDEPIEMVLARSSQETLVVNVEWPPAE
jgi:uncharacterized RmlC-like cupin family protein